MLQSFVIMMEFLNLILTRSKIEIQISHRYHYIITIIRRSNYETETETNTMTEVFRLSPSDLKTDKYYLFATYTRKEGKWPNVKYFTSNELRYVGKFVRCETWGYGDGSGAAAYFDKGDGVIERIEYDYEGTTCFLETNPVPMPPYYGLSEYEYRSD